VKLKWILNPQMYSVNLPTSLAYVDTHIATVREFEVMWGYLA